MDHYCPDVHTYDSVCNHKVIKIDRIAQLVEQPTCYRKVVGSGPTSGIFIFCIGLHTLVLRPHVYIFTPSVRWTHQGLYTLIRILIRKFEEFDS